MLGAIAKWGPLHQISPNLRVKPVILINSPETWERKVTFCQDAGFRTNTPILLVSAMNIHQVILRKHDTTGFLPKFLFFYFF